MTKGIDDHGYTYAGPRAKRLTAEQFVDAIWQITGAAPTKMDAGVLRGKVDPELAKQIKIQGQWIWGHSAKPGSTPPSGETITLRKTLKLDTEPASASAVVTCDNGYTLYVNNRKVSAGDDWTKLAAVPLQTALRKGANSILVIATNAGKGPNPAGFFFDARVRDAAGKETAISSDATWEWTPQAPPTKEGRIPAFEAKDWQPVTVVKALGAWQQTIHAQAPALLAQGAAASDRMIRASLMKSDFLMRTLGRPNHDQIVTARPNDLTTLEAIDLANGSILSTSITKGAQRLLASHAPSPAALISALYHQALCRQPSASELATALSLIGEKPTQQSLEDLLWAVCMLPEFQTVR